MVGTVQWASNLLRWCNYYNCLCTIVVPAVTGVEVLCVCVCVCVCVCLCMRVWSLTPPSIPFCQFTEILGKVWTYHDESNLRQTEAFASELEEVIQQFNQVSVSSAAVYCPLQCSQDAYTTLHLLSTYFLHPHPPLSFPKDTYNDILLARSTSQTSMDRFTSCKQGMKTTDVSTMALNRER